MYENAQANDSLWHDMLTERPIFAGRCECCNRCLYSGDTAYEIDGDYYCEFCVTEVEMMGDDE